MLQGFSPIRAGRVLLRQWLAWLLTRVVHAGAQAAGLKYYEDMQQRIPREETATIEAVVREAVVDLLHCREAQDASTLFCHAVGRWAACTCLMAVRCKAACLVLQMPS